ncbi:MAG: DUF2723 domain-containing protein [Chitinophagaceae bacterium]
MNFRKINNITGWIIGLIACTVYIVTREGSNSFWDVGEFTASAYKVQMPHPPGAPLFVLLGRFFVVLFGNNPQHAAQAVNLMSAVASGVTILFLFWTITHFARKMFVTVGEELTSNQIFTVMAAGVVGSLAYCFSDTFWYSAVEGEVYALSSFFTALVFWAMLKWEHADEKAGNDELAKARVDRWIVFIFFAMGLSIGVHLLNLLTIPAIVMIYYFRRYNYTPWGVVGAFVIGCLITGLVQVVIIQYSMKAAGLVDIFFVNDLNMGFFSGFTFYFLLIGALIVSGLRFRANKVSPPVLSIWLGLILALLFLPWILKGESGAGKVLKFLLLVAVGFVAYTFKPSAFKGIKLALWCYAFMMLGYFSYLTPMIRSNANPAIDMNNVDNPMNLVYLLGREQYGSQPIFYGPHYVARYKPDPSSRNGVEMKKGEMKYVKNDSLKKYIPIGTDDEPTFESEDMQVFPRVWDRSNEQGHAQFYADWLNLYERDLQGNITGYKAPTYGDNIKWFFTYQMGLMYWRYFMWNFAGRQNDVQGFGNVRDGNWISGISFIDNQMLGDQSKMPESSTTNKAHNKLYLLPFLLGILGCVVQFIRNRKDWIVTFLLFFFTGIAIVIYLNQPGNQPRERDYAYAGSFYAFAIWIGLAVPSIVRLVREADTKTFFNNTLGMGAALSFLIGLMSFAWHTSFLAAVMIAAMYTLFTAVVVMLIRSASKGKNLRLINILAATICAIVPILMAQQEWDDHDRSKKRLASDIARDYLESCAPNAILITFGDNDTYPLWYAQEVEGVRPDIRIINNSLLGIDWYINQLRYKINQSDPIDVIWTPEQIEGHNREYMEYQADPRVDPNKFYSLYDVMKNVLGSPVIDPETKRDEGPQTFPVKRFMVPVDTSFVRKNGTVNAKDTTLPYIQFELPGEPGSRIGFTRSDWMILNIIAANGWKRPIYFTSPYTALGFGNYLRKDGLTYRLVPAVQKSNQQNWVVRTFMTATNDDVMLDNLLNKFVYTSKPGVYFDEENRRHALNLRSTYAEAAGNLADKGRKKEALKLLQKCESFINSKDLPYAMIGRDNGHNINGLVYLEACYKAGNFELAEKVKAALKKDLEEQKAYYEYLRNNKEDLYGGFDGQNGEAYRNDRLLDLLDFLDQQYNPKAQTQKTIETNQPTITNIAKPGSDTQKKVDSNK